MRCGCCDRQIQRVCVEPATGEAGRFGLSRVSGGGAVVVVAPFRHDDCLTTGERVGAGAAGRSTASALGK